MTYVPIVPVHPTHIGDRRVANCAGSCNRKRIYEGYKLVATMIPPPIWLNRATRTASTRDTPDPRTFFYQTNPKNRTGAIKNAGPAKKRTQTNPPQARSNPPHAHSNAPRQRTNPRRTHFLPVWHAQGRRRQCAMPKRSAGMSNSRSRCDRHHRCFTHRLLTSRVFPGDRGASWGLTDWPEAAKLLGSAARRVAAIGRGAPSSESRKGD